MDINPLTAQTLSIPNRNALNLKVGQLLEAKVASLAEKNTMVLALGGKTITVQSNPPMALSPGQDLKIQVAQTTPTIEFKIIAPLPEQKNQPIPRLTLMEGRNPTSGITPTPLPVNQPLNAKGTQSVLKNIPSTNTVPEAKIAGFIKQFLPRHEVSPIFLNQLIKDLPQLMQNETVPTALKDIAAKIIQNLPPKEQLITSQGLRQSLNNSGLFLEAKLAQAEFINQLPQLINNGSIPQSLQSIAAALLQNLTQKLPANEIDGNSETASLILEETAPGQLPNAEKTLQDDFKANLLKFIHALKQEISQQSSNPPELDLLKNLQNKTENTVAKIVLDQLSSLPNDNSPKQVWAIDIPFIDRQQAETVKIEIQQDQKNSSQPGNSDWSVTITITPPKLDTIHCIVSFHNAVINTYFKSQSLETTELIKQNLDYLKKQLEESGLTTGHMDALDGFQKTQAPLQLAGKKLFDEKA